MLEISVVHNKIRKRYLDQTFRGYFPNNKYPKKVVNFWCHDIYYSIVTKGSVLSCSYNYRRFHKRNVTVKALFLAVCKSEAARLSLTKRKIYTIDNALKIGLVV